MSKHTAAVKAASALFRRYGYEVRAGKTNQTKGPDITLISKDEVWRVEVLTTRKTNSGSYQTTCVQPHRRNDDYAFISFNTDEHTIMPMSMYRDLMAVDGSLTVSGYMRLIGGSP